MSKNGASGGAPPGRIGMAETAILGSYQIAIDKRFSLFQKAHGM
jgi:hypothetical protein